ncbi:hypothetical protein HDU91_007383, partial [Kappamyces sp. JEL0680]
MHDIIHRMRMDMEDIAPLSGGHLEDTLRARDDEISQLYRRLGQLQTGPNQQAVIDALREKLQ